MACTTGAGAELRWSQDDRDAVLQIAAPRAPATSIRFSACEGRIVPHLVLLEGRRAIDVSIQPGLVARLVGADTAALGRVASWVAGFARAQGAWAPADPAEAGVTAVVLGGAFPLVGAALDAGAAALPDVPRWAAATLSATSARAGARVAFAGRATRPVVSALAESLVSGLAADRTGPDGRPVDAAGPVPPALYPLALGLMAPALSPDRLSRVLRAVEPWRPLRHWPERASLVLVAGLTPALGEQRTERLLLDAARRPDGPSELAEAFQLYALVRHRAGPRLPSRVADLRAHCRALLPTDPNPGGVPAAPRPRPQSAPRRRRAPADAPRPARATAPAPPRPAPAPVPPRPMADDRRAAAFRAPATRATTVPDHVPLDHSPAVVALHGREVPGTGGRLRFAVPRTAAELAAWGERLHNCLATFAPAVNERRALVLGIERDGRLAACIDVRPDGLVRQLLGDRNRPVPRPDALAVVHALAERGLVARHLGGNDVWFERVAGP